ncbi:MULTISPECIES: carboxylesterase/lipase family protein [unclassified Sphingobium]|uniref:carboxylesterase/lipase family protein n=1 Tax=unclassified Sphingobium TaxID=2611147 RepID=UPI0035A57BDA
MIRTGKLRWLLGMAIVPALAGGAMSYASPHAPRAVAPVMRTAAIQTSEGPVVGVREGNVETYLGIPYAAAPVGNLRWRPPIVPARWISPRNADHFADWCLQVAPEGFSKPITNEDCLYLNVFTPKGASSQKRKRAVMVWIHGGGLRQGRSNDYDPTPLVEEGDVIFVSFNYRLNIMGFLAHPALNREGHDFGNYGLMDQQFALAWVRRNIAAFGGDPENITLIGESSGGANVFNHIASPRSAGLFHKAIVQSGSLWYGSFAPFYDGLPLTQAQDVGKNVAAMTGCSDVNDASCLRSLSAAQLADVVGKLPSYSFGVVVDGTIVNQSVTRKILSGDFNRVPVINGSNNDEWTWVEGLWERAKGRPLTAAELESHLGGTLGDFASKAVPHYPPAMFGGSAGAASARAVTDGLFMCPMLALNEALAEHTKVWGFEFNDRQAPFPFPAASFPYGAAHTLEMQYIFKNYTGAVGERKSLSPDQKRLSNAMVGYWTNFAKSGNPNGPGLAKWPMMTVEKARYLSLEPPKPQQLSSASIDVDHQCATLWRDTTGLSSMKSLP